MEVLIMGMGVRGGMGVGNGNSRFIGGGNLIFSVLNLLILLAILGCVIYLVVRAVKDSKKNKPVINSQAIQYKQLKYWTRDLPKAKLPRKNTRLKKN
jgi:uncharacterized membrane protein